MSATSTRESTAGAALTLLLTCVGGFMLLLDLTVVNLALPAIARDLPTTLDGLKWVINAYALSLGAVLLLAGAIMDAVNRWVAFGVAVLVFAGASLCCGLSGSGTVLVAFRVVQGAAGAFVSCGALALLAERFTGRARLSALAWFSASAASATALGPLIGGAFVEYAGWRWVFLINVPIGVAVAVVCFSLAGATHSPGGSLRGLDWAGAALFGAAMLCVNRFLIDSADSGSFGMRTGSWAMAGVVAGAAFVGVEARVARPMLPLRYFRRPRFCASVVTSFTVRAATFGAAFYLAMFFQLNAKLSAVDAGGRMLPLTLGIIAGAIAAKRSEDRPSRLPGTPLAYLVLGGGLLWLAAVDQRSAYEVVGPLIAVGAATGALSTSALATAVSELPGEHSGLASAVTTTFMSIGTAAGVALLGGWAGGGHGGLATAPIRSIGTILLVGAAVPAVTGLGWLALSVRAGSGVPGAEP